MRPFKLANVLLEDTPQFATEPTLVCRSTVTTHAGDDGSWVLPGGSTHDFTTFFNALSVKKWRTYTVCRDFSLHIELQGGPCRLTQTRADTFSWYSEEVPESTVNVQASDSWQAFDLPLVSHDGDVVVGFKIETEGTVRIRNSYYSALVDESLVRPVELALCTTTFKREEFIERNISLIKDRILASDEPIARHFCMHVVDNGRTLDISALEAPGVAIHPNKNAGGAGGFARGMIEALRQTPKATHVLLMDDDVIVSPESILRTYNLLSLVTDEYAEAFLSGAMMNMDECDVRWEDLGYVAPDARFYPLKERAHMGVLHDMVENEALEPPDGGIMGQHYAAWWYCVIPVPVIEHNGLPLPIFVRCDDVEYSLRCKPRFMSMNGICVWHLSFLMKYSAAVERYQMMRNVFVAQAASDIAPLSDPVQSLKLIVRLELKKFNYTDAELALDGFEDFLKGPGFIAEPVAEERFMRANKLAEKHVPLDELNIQAQRENIDLEHVTTADITRVVPRSPVDRILDFATCNGQRFDLGYIQKGTHAVIDAAGWEYPAGTIRRKDTLVAIDMQNRRGVIRHMDRTRYRTVWKRLKKDLAYYKTNKERLHREYAAARAGMTSVAYWKNYLGIE